MFMNSKCRKGWLWFSLQNVLVHVVKQYKSVRFFVGKYSGVIKSNKNDVFNLSFDIFIFYCLLFVFLINLDPQIFSFVGFCHVHYHDSQFLIIYQKIKNTNDKQWKTLQSFFAIALSELTFWPTNKHHKIKTFKSAMKLPKENKIWCKKNEKYHWSKLIFKSNLDVKSLARWRVTSKSNIDDYIVRIENYSLEPSYNIQFTYIVYNGVLRCVWSMFAFINDIQCSYPLCVNHAKGQIQYFTLLVDHYNSTNCLTQNLRFHSSIYNTKITILNKFFYKLVKQYKQRLVYVHFITVENSGVKWVNTRARKFDNTSFSSKF